VVANRLHHRRLACFEDVQLVHVALDLNSLENVMPESEPHLGPVKLGTNSFAVLVIIVGPAMSVPTVKERPLVI
jgi:hypothetical protein